MTVTLSIIIVNYNVRILLEKCLLSVSSAGKDIEMEVIVVDNNSSDGSIDYVKPLFPSFHFIVNTENTGFSKANNQGLELASGQYILFLNPDTVIPEDCFSKCIHFMESHPDAGALGVKMVNGMGIYLKESKRGFPSPVTSLWKLSGITSIFPRSKYLARYYMGNLDQNASHRVDVLSGAFMFVKKAVLDKTGGFDERFFMYAEDIDLSCRIKKAGYNNYYFAGISIIHYKGGSTKKDFKYVKMFYKAMSQFAKKHYGAGIFTALLDAGIWTRAGLEILKNVFKKSR
ncbi:MAG: glycosyltransferase family 2 protein [Chitinophagaceae bacterium]|nr:glycosyltransferase family 2 protein [Chitinophagaceae bacterium]